jgi:hypothetical protein
VAAAPVGTRQQQMPFQWIKDVVELRSALYRLNLSGKDTLRSSDAAIIGMGRDFSLSLTRTPA